MITNFLIGAVIVAAGWAFLAFGHNWFDTMTRRAKKGGMSVMPIDQPPAIVEQIKPGKTFSVQKAYNGWWARIEGHAYPFGAWRMDRGPYPFRWMAELEFPIERLTKDGPRR